MARLVLATLVSPLAVTPAAFVALPFLQLETLVGYIGFTSVYDFAEAWLATTALVGAAGFGIALIGNVVIGLPLYAVLRYFDLAMPAPCALLGGVIGLLMGERIEAAPSFALLAAACGAAVAGAYCGLANKPEERPVVFWAGFG